MATSVEVDRASYSVIEAVADRVGVDPTELRPGLSDVVDPDSLDHLFARAGDGESASIGCIEFRYCGYDVTVYSDGRVDVGE